MNLWKILEYADWANNKDYKAIGAEMAMVFNRDVLIAARSFEKDKLKELESVLEQHSMRMTGKEIGYYGLGNDGFWDLRSHIIGLGKEFYNRVLKDPEIAKTMADAGDYKENFGYIFHYALPKGRCQECGAELKEEWCQA